LDTNGSQQTINLVATQANGEAVDAVDRHVVAQVVPESQSLRKRGRPPKVMAFSALYSCEECDVMWTQSTGSQHFNDSQRCDHCRHDYTPEAVIDTKGFNPTFNTCYYGEYECSNHQCLCTWSSHQSWLGYQRKCPMCAHWVYPNLLRTHEWVGVNRSLSTGNGVSKVTTNGSASRVGAEGNDSSKRLYLWITLALALLLAMSVLLMATGAHKDYVWHYLHPMFDGLVAKVTQHFD